MSTEAMKLALEALEVGSYYGTGKQEAITALRKALAEQPAQQEPTSGDYALGYAEGFNDACKPAQQEPVAWMQDSIELYVQDIPSATYTIPLYTSPPAQRPWVGLADKEIWREYQSLWPFHPAGELRLAADLVTFVRAIEAKLRSKNT